MATQKITMGRGKDTDYQSKKAAAVAQAEANSYVFGVQSAYAQGGGAASKSSRDPYMGNVNMMQGDVIAGEFGNFSPRSDSVGNQVLSDPLNTTGYLEGQTSMTSNPQADPEMAGADAAMRVQMLANGVQYGGLNNRAQIMGA